MASVGSSTVKGAGVGAAVGSVVPLVGNVIGGAVGAVGGFLSGIFSSKKHYNLYAWDAQNYTWQFVIEGHPDQIRAAAKNYTAAGIQTTVVRNKSGSGIAPTTPPTGAVAPAVAGSSSVPWILAGIAGLGLLVFVLLRRRR